jgi:hypothetical protein
MFKTSPIKQVPATLELGCSACGVILVINPPKGERTYPCVCGTILEIAISQAA